MFETRRQFASYCVGIVLASAFWMYVSGTWRNNAVTHHTKFVGYEPLPGVGAFIAFVMINLIDLKRLIGPDSQESACLDRWIRGWWFFWTMFFLICAGGALWIWIDFYWNTWTGIAIFLQTIMIAIDAEVYLWLRSAIVDKEPE
jgi:hypothetical protein